MKVNIISTFSARRRKSAFKFELEAYLRLLTAEKEGKLTIILMHHQFHTLYLFIFLLLSMLFAASATIMSMVSVLIVDVEPTYLNELADCRNVNRTFVIFFSIVSGVEMYFAMKQFKSTRNVEEFYLWPNSYRDKVARRLKKIDPSFDATDLPF